MLLSISPNSTESENVVKELALASERKKPIIPVYLEAAEIPETMEYQLAGIQRVEYFREGRFSYRGYASAHSLKEGCMSTRNSHETIWMKDWCHR